MDTYVVTGGAGFIGSNLVRHLLATRAGVRVVAFDRLTYAGNLDNLDDVSADPRYRFIHGDICDRTAVDRMLAELRPRGVFNLAAESHVDRSIAGPAEFVRTNVVGAFEMLDAARSHWASLDGEAREQFRFLHVSTDEVYGSLGAEGAFTEETRYAPSSPYAASKAGADHLARVYFHTYGLPVVTTNCSNNYGPRQFPEKLIPLVTLRALEGRPLPVYGDGEHVRDWLYVEDHCEALALVMDRGAPGQTYNIGGREERTTLEVVQTICDLLDELAPPRSRGLTSYRELITHVADRPGHDRRYAIDPSKIRGALGWSPTTPFEQGIRRTITWYLENRAWCNRITTGEYRRSRAP